MLTLKINWLDFRLIVTKDLKITQILMMDFPSEEVETIKVRKSMIGTIKFQKLTSKMIGKWMM